MDKQSGISRVAGPRSARPQATARRYGAAAIVLLLALAGCAAPAPREAPPAQPPPSTQVYFYPTKGQSAARQERDRYECYLWAMKQTGFDPSQPMLAPHQRFEVLPSPPPGQDTAAGAITGAVIGAIVSPRGRSAEGAVVGAVAGAMIGAASDTARQAEAERVQRKYDQRDAQRMAQLEQQAADYRRAMTACLEGRGYTVR